MSPVAFKSHSMRFKNKGRPPSSLLTAFTSRVSMSISGCITRKNKGSVYLQFPGVDLMRSSIRIESIRGGQEMFVLWIHAGEARLDKML